MKTGTQSAGPVLLVLIKVKLETRVKIAQLVKLDNIFDKIVQIQPTQYVKRVQVVHSPWQRILTDVALVNIVNFPKFF